MMKKEVKKMKKNSDENTYRVTILCFNCMEEQCVRIVKGVRIIDYKKTNICKRCRCLLF